MLTNLEFLQTGQPWPPKQTEERARLIRYRDNRALFEGRHELVFHEVFARLFRRDPNMKMSIEMVLGWPKRLSTLWADLLVGETPAVSDAGTELAQYVSDLVQRLDLWRRVYLAALDTSRYGNAVFKVRRDEKGVKVAVIPPACWFPVVSDTDAKEVAVHVLAWPTGDPSAGTGKLHVELHTPGHVEYRDYARGGSPLTGNVGGNIGKLLSQTGEDTGVDAPLVVPVSNLETSDAIYGHDDYSDLTSIIQELEVRFAQLARILDKHADPKMYGPDVTRVDEETGLTVADLGDYIPMQDKTEVPPGYLVWNAQTESSFKQIEMLMQQFYILSETSPAVFGEIKSGLAESGSALRPYRMEPCRRAVRRFEPFLRQRQRSRAERGRAVRGKEARHAKEAFLRAVGKIRAAVAVQVNVHKSGQQHRARCAAAWPHCRNAAGIYLHIAGVKAEIRAKVKDAFKQHRRSPPLSCFGFSRNTHIQAR